MSQNAFYSLPITKQLSGFLKKNICHLLNCLNSSGKREVCVMVKGPLNLHNLAFAKFC